MKFIDGTAIAAKIETNPPIAFISYDTVEDGKKYYACYKYPHCLVDSVLLQLVTPRGSVIVYHAVELQAPPPNVDWMVIG